MEPADAPSEFFSFDELDELEAERPPPAPSDRLVSTGWKARGHSRLKTLSGAVRVVNAFSGECTCMAQLVDAAIILDLKEAIAEATDMPAAFQRLFLEDEELRDLTPLSRLPEEAPAVSIVYGFSDVLKRLADGELELRNADYLSNHRELVLAAVQANGAQLRYAAPELQADKDIVLAAIHAAQPPRPLERASSSPLEWAADTLRRDHEVALAAVLQDGTALEYAAEELQDDKDIVSAAIQATGKALQYASEALRGDPQLVVRAMRRDRNSLRHAAPALRRNRDFLLGCVTEDGLLLEHAEPELQCDPDVVLAAVQNNWQAFQYAAMELRGDPEFVLNLLRDPQVHKDAFWYASDDLKGSGSIVHTFMAELYPNMYAVAC